VSRARGCFRNANLGHSAAALKASLPPRADIPGFTITLMSLIPQTDVVFLLDVDNTLLDNDRIEQDLRAHTSEAFGVERQKRYWDIFEQLRAGLGYADYLGALQQYRIEHPDDPQLLAVSLFLVNYPFAERLYPGAMDVVHGDFEWMRTRPPATSRSTA